MVSRHPQILVVAADGEQTGRVRVCCERGRHPGHRVHAVDRVVPDVPGLLATTTVSARYVQIAVRADCYVTETTPRDCRGRSRRDQSSSQRGDRTKRTVDAVDVGAVGHDSGTRWERYARRIRAVVVP